MRHDLNALLVAEGGVILTAAQTPARRAQLRRLKAQGTLTTLLPGVYVTPADAQDFHIRVAAVQRRYPDAVFTAAAAARLTYWATIDVPVVTVAQRRDQRVTGPFRFERRAIAPEHIVEPYLLDERQPVRCTSAAVTALDLAAFTNGESIDRAFRAGVATPQSLGEVIRSDRRHPGNREQARWLADSRDQPWSIAERLAHRLLREAGLRGWVANLRVQVAGRTYFLDIGFRRQRLALEIDGLAYHSGAAAFEADRERQNALLLDGWRVLRLTWAMLTNHPDRVIAMITALLADHPLG